MRKLIATAALASLAACTQPAPEPETDATEAATPAETAVTMAADGKPSTGKYEVTMDDGQKIIADVRPDGTFEVTDADGKVVDTGKWVQKSPEQYCETSDREGAKEICYTEKFEDGVYTSLNPETGKTATVVRVEG